MIDKEAQKWLDSIFKVYPELDSKLGYEALQQAFIRPGSNDEYIFINYAIDFYNEEIQKIHESFREAFFYDAKPPKLLKKLDELEYEYV